MKTQVTKQVSGASFTINRNDTSKKAGSNSVAITVHSDSWTIPDQTVYLTRRQAIAFANLLNTEIE